MHLGDFGILRAKVWVYRFVLLFASYCCLPLIHISLRAIVICCRFPAIALHIRLLIPRGRFPAASLQQRRGSTKHRRFTFCGVVAIRRSIWHVSATSLLISCLSRVAGFNLPLVNLCLSREACSPADSNTRCGCRPHAPSEAGEGARLHDLPVGTKILGVSMSESFRLYPVATSSSTSARECRTLCKGASSTTAPAATDPGRTFAGNGV